MVTSPRASDATFTVAKNASSIGASHTFGSDSQTATPATASEDFSAISVAFESPYTYWFVGSTDRERYRDANERGTVSTEIPGNHSPEFAPVAEPTVVRIAQSHLTAAMAVFNSGD